MNMINNYDERVWDRLLDFVFPDEKGLTREAVQADLRRSGVDMRRPSEKLQNLLKDTRETRDARATLEAARQSRQAVLSKLMTIKAASGPVIREKLKDVIANRLSGPQQAVYARKLEDAASDEDLKSLLEDLSRLEAFMEESDNDS